MSELKYGTTQVDIMVRLLEFLDGLESKAQALSDELSFDPDLVLEDAILDLAGVARERYERDGYYLLLEPQEGKSAIDRIGEVLEELAGIDSATETDQTAA